MIMADELSRAISFANGYFVLADGLVPDLADHLAEDVVLDWFGQTIEGRVNVATFMKDQKISSRHMFNEVNPVATIGYRKQRALRRKYYSMGGTHENGNLIGIRSNNDDNDDDDDDGNENENENDDNYQIKYKRQCFSDGIVMENANLITDESCDDIHDMEVECDDQSAYSKISSKMHDEIKKKHISETSVINTMECNLNFDRLKLDSDNISIKIHESRNFLNSAEVNCAPDKLGKKIKLESELKTTNINEMERKIDQLNNKIMEIPLGVINKEVGQGDGPPIHYEMNSIKYIEACGVIEFSRFFNTKQIRKDIRKRFCRLQIAYSVKNKDLHAPMNELSCESMPENSMEMDGNEVQVVSKKSSKLKSLKELRQMSNSLIPHDDDKIDFSTDDDDDDDNSNERNKFLKCLKLQAMDDKNENMNDLVTPKYVRHQLTFDKSPKRLLAGTGDTRGFLFNYDIHLIIYESNTKCRLNLSHEFENKELSDN